MKNTVTKATEVLNESQVSAALADAIKLPHFKMGRDPLHRTPFEIASMSGEEQQLFRLAGGIAANSPLETKPGEWGEEFAKITSSEYHMANAVRILALGVKERRDLFIEQVKRTGGSVAFAGLRGLLSGETAKEIVAGTILLDLILTHPDYPAAAEAVKPLFEAEASRVESERKARQQRIIDVTKAQEVLAKARKDAEEAHASNPEIKAAKARLLELGIDVDAKPAPTAEQRTLAASFSADHLAREAQARQAEADKFKVASSIREFREAEEQP